jgi:hypothetical protein
MIQRHHVPGMLIEITRKSQEISVCCASSVAGLHEPGPVEPMT